MPKSLCVITGKGESRMRIFTFSFNVPNKCFSNVLTAAPQYFMVLEILRQYVESVLHKILTINWFSFRFGNRSKNY